jgi:hypothetical protein
MQIDDRPVLFAVLNTPHLKHYGRGDADHMRGGRPTRHDLVCV